MGCKKAASQHVWRNYQCIIKSVGVSIGKIIRLATVHHLLAITMIFNNKIKSKNKNGVQLASDTRIIVYSLYIGHTMMSTPHTAAPEISGKGCSMGLKQAHLIVRNTFMTMEEW